MAEIHLLSTFKFKVAALAVSHLLSLLVRLPNKKDGVVIHIEMLAALDLELLGL